HHGALVSGSAGEVMASETCTRVWEAAYRQYAARGNGVLGAAKVTPRHHERWLPRPGRWRRPGDRSPPLPRCRGGPWRLSSLPPAPSSPKHVTTKPGTPARAHDRRRARQTGDASDVRRG